MKRIFYLSTCDTCSRILASWKTDGIEMQDIKTEPMTAAQVDHMIELAGSAEALFSKRARKYKELGLKDKNLSDAEMRQFIIDEYTFLKRPVLVLEEQIFVGNAKKVVEAAAQALLL
jgi:arsenate reductase